MPVCVSGGVAALARKSLQQLMTVRLCASVQVEGVNLDLENMSTSTARTPPIFVIS